MVQAVWRVVVAASLSLSLFTVTASSENRLGLDYLTKTQRLRLWERVQRAGGFEAVARYCGVNTLLETRIAEAVKPCVTAAALGAAKAHFWSGFRRDTMPPLRNKDAFCGDSEMQGIIARHARRADQEVAEAAQLCKRCRLSDYADSRRPARTRQSLARSCQLLQ